MYTNGEKETNSWLTLHVEKANSKKRFSSKYIQAIHTHTHTHTRGHRHKRQNCIRTECV